MKDYSVSHTNTNGSVFPNTAAVNASSPSATDGTEYVKLTIDDLWGFNQALMREAGLTPDGNDETATASQRVEALRFMVQNSAVNAYFNGTNWIYVANGTASRWTVDDANEVVKFQVAASGTAGNPITWVDVNGIGGFLHVQDQKPSGTAGGGSTGGAYATRALNTVLTNTISGASLGGNQITLPAGEYLSLAISPGYRINAHRIKLYDVTTPGDLIIGGSKNSSSTNNVQTDAILSERFTLLSAKNIELRHFAGSTIATNGFGLPASSGDVEIYSDVKIWKIG